MKILLTRTARKPRYTIGRLSINGTYMCDTIEDRDRGLAQDMPLDTLRRLKVYGQTAIPTGTYKVIWTFSPRFGKYLPQLHNVPMFSCIRMHAGNTTADTLGCIILGENKAVGMVLNSRAACARVMPLIQQAISRDEPVTIQIR